MMSGWQIYNASPLLDFKFSRDVTLGGWLGGALQWHFSAMWLLGVNGLIYVCVNLGTQRFISKFFPLSFDSLVSDLRAALKGQLHHADPQHYNALQRLAYLMVVVDGLALVLSGLVLWKPVQFDVLRTVFGDYDMARWTHFSAMVVMVSFVVVHLVMVALVPRSLLAMVRGR